MLYSPMLLLLMLAPHSRSLDIFEANKALGRGINLGGALEAPTEGAWGITIQDEWFRVIKNAGFDSIRLPVNWAAHSLKAAPYTIEPAFFKRVDHLLDMAEKSKLKMVLNIHHFSGLDMSPDAHLEHFLALWKQIATRYKARPSSVYFELNNEPHEKLDDQKWNAILAKGLAVVRETNPTRPVIIGPTFWNGIWALPKLTLPDDENLIVTVHTYNPFDFTHQGAAFADAKIRNIKNKAWAGTETELKAMCKELDQAQEWGKAHNRPIYLGEFGVYEKAPMDSRVRWTASMVREAEARGFSWAYWEFGSGFGVYDIKRKAWQDKLLQALIPRAEK
jgi:endoglucanase